MFITGEEQLRGQYGTMHPLAVRKVLDRLDEYCRRFIALSPFLVLATSGADGMLDASPRGDDPGFVQPIDDHTLLIPDRPGNNRVDSLCNVVATGQVGLLFMVPGLRETLRVNGTARLSTDPELLATAVVGGKPPISCLLVTVQEAYFHCGKAIIRSHLWEPERALPKGSFPGIGRIISEQLQVGDPAELEQAVEEEELKTLY
jgi:PPOX class probable FMN-dependent enzyme